MTIEKIEKENRILGMISLAAIALVLGGVEIDKVNLGFITIKNVGYMFKWGLFLGVSYLLWGAYQNWRKSVAKLCDENLEEYLCTYLTEVLVDQIREEGPHFCETNQTKGNLRDWANVSAKSSCFLYDAHCGKSSNNRRLRVQLQHTNEFNSTSEIEHVVHGFYSNEMPKLKRAYWFQWVAVQPFFKQYILPAIFGCFAWVTLVAHLLVG
ncbi:hypothetical protein MH171_000059 [Vibrio parahaemolyticus]|nr:MULTISPECIES: hypothetical protein [Vibrio]MDW2294747.1 hypothetical protein [Vibrio sp. 1404]AVF74768.1 hypothetical protein AL539_13750 [Vibrio alginolyticus]EIW7860167.1 hypothetical protein [Vibrio parahaemolyticus]ELA7254626.1 hypothetical protein [Vibrio parahaemolyticus]EMF1837843.1 hypothetical protein [Vibrio parahaemolyticus]